MLSALKLNSFLSQPRVYILVFPLGRCVFQTGTSESSGDRNTLHCETFKKYYRGTLGAQGRKATSPSNSLALMLGCPQSHLSTHWAWARSRTHGDLAALTQDLTTLTLAPTKAFIAQAQAQARGVSPSRGLRLHVARLLFQPGVCRLRLRPSTWGWLRNRGAAAAAPRAPSTASPGKHILKAAVGKCGTFLELLSTHSRPVENLLFPQATYFHKPGFLIFFLIFPEC